MTQVQFGTQWNGNVEGVTVGNIKGQVVVSLGEQRHLERDTEGWHSHMSPDTARELADALIREAEEAELSQPITEEDVYDATAGGDY